jgi:hypothetical protein
MWSDIVTFIVAVVSHWQSYVTGGAVAGLIAVMERLSNWKMPKWAYATVFLGVFLLVSFFLTWREQYQIAQQVPTLQSQLRDRENQIQALRDKPAQVQVNVPPAIINFPPQMAYMSSSDLGVVLTSYKIGGNVAVNGTCKNISPTVIAEEAACVRGLRVVNTKLNPANQPIVTEAVQDKTYREFEKSLKTIAITRKSYGPGEAAFNTVYSPLVDQQLDSDLRSGSKTVLFLADYSWKDAVGKHTNRVCTWLQIYPGMFSGPGVLSPSAIITWNNCINHNGLQK